MAKKINGGVCWSFSCIFFCMLGSLVFFVCLIKRNFYISHFFLLYEFFSFSHFHLLTFWWLFHEALRVLFFLFFGKFKLKSFLFVVTIFHVSWISKRMEWINFQIIVWSMKISKMKFNLTNLKQKISKSRKFL